MRGSGSGEDRRHDFWSSRQAATGPTAARRTSLAAKRDAAQRTSALISNRFGGGLANAVAATRRRKARDGHPDRRALHRHELVAGRHGRRSRDRRAARADEPDRWPRTAAGGHPLHAAATVPAGAAHSGLDQRCRSGVARSAVSRWVRRDLSGLGLVRYCSARSRARGELGQREHSWMRSPALQRLTIIARARSPPASLRFGQLRQHHRHRLDGGGNRRINATIHRIAVTCLRCHPETRDYIARQRAEGKSTKEAIRCLKRHLTRRLWHLLQIRAPPRLRRSHHRVIDI